MTTYGPTTGWGAALTGLGGLATITGGIVLTVASLDTCRSPYSRPGQNCSKGNPDAQIAGGITLGAGIVMLAIGIPLLVIGVNQADKPTSPASPSPVSMSPSSFVVRF